MLKAIRDSFWTPDSHDDLVCLMQKNPPLIPFHFVNLGSGCWLVMLQNVKMFILSYVDKDDPVCLMQNVPPPMPSIPLRWISSLRHSEWRLLPSSSLFYSIHTISWKYKFRKSGIIAVQASFSLSLYNDNQNSAIIGEKGSFSFHKKSWYCNPLIVNKLLQLWSLSQ